MTFKELREIDILQWNWIQKDFKRNKYQRPELLIGNGFSLNFSNNFSYNKLFDKFQQNVSPNHNSIFAQFGTTNFEFIMRQLNYTHRVNSILSLDPLNLVQNTINELKEGLIKTVRELHPTGAVIDWDKLKRITRSLRNFGDIYSTNYDIFLYHLVMASKDDKDKNKKLMSYQDYFWGEWNSKYNEFMGRQAYSFKNVYYLHGALFIFNFGIANLKLKRTNQELIDTIANEIHLGNIPLFVSEGTSNEKLEVIKNNYYLDFCFDKLRESGKPILIYGHSLSDFDEHICKAIKNTKRKIIFAIYTPNKTELELQETKYQVIKAFGFKKHDKNSLTFVDSTSVFPY
jgi:Domain of unknown function (DUF4917)